MVGEAGSAGGPWDRVCGMDRSRSGIRVEFPTAGSPQQREDRRTAVAVLTACLEIHAAPTPETERAWGSTLGSVLGGLGAKPADQATEEFVASRLLSVMANLAAVAATTVVEASGGDVDDARDTLRRLAAELEARSAERE